MNNEKILSYLIDKTDFIYNNKKLVTLLKILPFTDFYNLYSKYNFCKSHLTHELLSSIIYQSNLKLLCNIKNQSVIKDLLYISGVLNSRYNFLYIDIKNKKKILNEKFNLDIFYNIDMDLYYSDYTFVDLVSNNNLFENVVLNQNLEYQINLYPKVEYLSLLKYDKSIFVKDNKNYVIIEIYNLKIIIYKKIYTLIDIVYENNLNNAVIDICLVNILCTPEYFVNLENTYVYKKLYNDDSNNIIKNITPLKIYIPHKIKNNIISSNKNINKCYICKKFYPSNIYVENYTKLCFNCGISNYNSRISILKIPNKTKVFITGIRKKLGYSLSLKLLRLGAIVYGTTRFPNMTILNYSGEKDYNEWKNNINIIKCDFLNNTDVNNISSIISSSYIDIFINNAKQNQKKSVEYYNKLNLLEYNLNDKFQDEEYTNSIRKELSNFKDIKFDSSYIIEKNISEMTNEDIIEYNTINNLIPIIFINKFVNSKSKHYKIIINIELKMNLIISNYNIKGIFKTFENYKNIKTFSINPGFYCSKYEDENIDYPLTIEDSTCKILNVLQEKL
jgi:hypothetical protein